VAAKSSESKPACGALPLEETHVLFIWNGRVYARPAERHFALDVDLVGWLVGRWSVGWLVHVLLMRRHKARIDINVGAGNGHAAARFSAKSADSSREPRSSPAMMTARRGETERVHREEKETVMTRPAGNWLAQLTRISHPGPSGTPTLRL